MWQDVVQSAQSTLSAVGNALSFAPPWAVSLVLLVGATAAAWLLHAAILAVLRRLLRRRRPYLRSVLDGTRNPTRFGLLLVALAIALPTAPLRSDTKSVIARVLVLGAICLLGWMAMTALHLAADFYLRHFRIDIDDNLLARKHITQVRVLTRVLDTVIVLVTLGFALMTFEAVRQYGVSLFASAGVAGVVFGLAAPAGAEQPHRRRSACNHAADPARRRRHGAEPVRLDRRNNGNLCGDSPGRPAADDRAA